MSERYAYAHNVVPGASPGTTLLQSREPPGTMPKTGHNFHTST